MVYFSFLFLIKKMPKKDIHSTNNKCIKELEMEISLIPLPVLPQQVIEENGISIEGNENDLQTFCKNKNIDLEQKRIYAIKHYNMVDTIPEVPLDLANVCVEEKINEFKKDLNAEEQQLLDTIISSTDYIDFSTYLNIIEQVTREVEHIIEGSDFVMCDNREKSQGWVCKIAYNILRDHPADIENVLQNLGSDHSDAIKTNFEFSKVITDGNTLVILDDGSYSGTQLSSNILNIYNEILAKIENQETTDSEREMLKNFKLVVGVGVYTEQSKQKLDETIAAIIENNPELIHPQVILGFKLDSLQSKLEKNMGRMLTEDDKDIIISILSPDTFDDSCLVNPAVVLSHKIPDAASTNYFFDQGIIFNKQSPPYKSTIKKLLEAIVNDNDNLVKFLLSTQGDRLMQEARDDTNAKDYRELNSLIYQIYGISDIGSSLKQSDSPLFESDESKEVEEFIDIALPPSLTSSKFIFKDTSLQTPIQIEQTAIVNKKASSQQTQTKR
jgi:hypothetical protein